VPTRGLNLTQESLRSVDSYLLRLRCSVLGRGRADPSQEADGIHDEDDYTQREETDQDRKPNVASIERRVIRIITCKPQRKIIRQIKNM